MGIKVSQSFPSKWLKADDIGMGRKVRAKIREAQLEKVGEDERIVIYFVGKDKGMVLNITNANILAQTYGDDSDGWLGKDIFVSVHMTTYKGKATPGLTIDTPKVESGWTAPAQQAPPQQQVAPGSYRPEAFDESTAPPHREPGWEAPDDDSNIPF